jgi:prepilin-type N-terminal cleavage/methylation domain-containing protein/prepilin-type processing-associated H-X9-DG protein
MIPLPPPSPPNLRHSRATLRHRAFTLIELLAVIAIIGILAAIILGAIGSVRKKAHQARCVSNLRQVGIALLAFVNDNKERLPGPVYLQVESAYSKKEYIPFVAYIAPYLGYPDISALGNGIRVDVPLLYCPSRGFAENNTVGTFALQAELDFTKTSNRIKNAFGDPVRDIAPIRYSELDALGGPSRVWSLLEVDQQVTYSSLNGSSWVKNTPEHPPHGGKRTFLWFDGRVTLLAELP